MVDVASVIVNHFINKQRIACINILENISKSSDCAISNSPTPRIRNIDILSSLAPVVLDINPYNYNLIKKEIMVIKDLL